VPFGCPDRRGKYVLASTLLPIGSWEDLDCEVRKNKALDFRFVFAEEAAVEDFYLVTVGRKK